MSREFSRPFIVNAFPLDGLKVSVVPAIGGELNMKGISKRAGRLQTSAQGQFPIIVIYYLGQIVGCTRRAENKAPLLTVGGERSEAHANGTFIINSAGSNTVNETQRGFQFIKSNKQLMFSSC